MSCRLNPNVPSLGDSASKESKSMYVKAIDLEGQDIITKKKLILWLISFKKLVLISFKIYNEIELPGIARPNESMDYIV